MRGRTASIVANPVLVGAVTLLVVVVGVFLAYNANKGLPFVPTYEFNVETPDAARLVVGNEVREGGFRIGQVSEIETVRLDNGRLGATLEVALDEKFGPIPKDSDVIIRPRSALGLKYVDLVRGESTETLPRGATLAALDEETIPPEFDDFLEMFQEPVRRDIRTNLITFGGGFAGRGADLNRTLVSLPPLLRDLVPVMRELAAPDTQLARFFTELEDAARLVAPVSDDFAAGFTSMADTFEAFSRDPDALARMISEGPPTLRTGIRDLPAQRPFLRRLAGISDEVSATAAAIRTTARPVADALAEGIEVLPRTPAVNEDFDTALAAIRDFARSPTTNLVLDGLTATAQTLTPTLRYVGPHVTVCNYWNYWWTFLSDHLSEEDSTGTLERIAGKSAPRTDDSLTTFGASEPVNGQGGDPITQAFEGDPPELHAQFYGRAVDEQGNADCESGQRGYPKRLAEGMPPEFNIAIDPRTPGNQGTTFTGRPRVPEGQTFSAEPAGRGPKVVTNTP
jgi:ABC-type transporter Mla subunit MlaD